MSLTPGADPFGTAAIRASSLTAWLSSPTRLREDANVEEDHARGYYRDRAIIELAQNAADAAVAGEGTGRLLLRLRTHHGGALLTAANTGAPLTTEGVLALASMRASAKGAGVTRPGSFGTGATVGRFGVGFSAVRALSDELGIASAGHAVAFSAARARALLADAVADHARSSNDRSIVSALRQVLERPSADLPILRLPFALISAGTEPADTAPAGTDPGGADPTSTDPTSTDPTSTDPAGPYLGASELTVPPGYDTAVVARLRGPHEHATVRRLLESLDDALLLALPVLAEIRVEIEGAEPRTLTGATERCLTVHTEGHHRAIDLADRPHEERTRTRWSVTWAFPRSGTAADLREHLHEPHVLHAPTPTDEPCTLPALLVATFPLDPSRRHVAPGAATDALAVEAGRAYAELAEGVARGGGDALALVPTGLAAGRLDELLRTSAVAALRTRPFLVPVQPDDLPVQPDDLPVQPDGLPVQPDDPPVQPDGAARAGASAQPDHPAQAGDGALPEQADGAVPDPDPESDSPPPDPATQSGAIARTTPAAQSHTTPEPARLLAPREAQAIASPVGHDPAALAALAPAAPGLVAVPRGLEAHARLRAVGVEIRELADAVDGLPSQQEPGRWRAIYDALEPHLAEPGVADALAGLPVPLADGRTVRGPRGLVAPSGALGGTEAAVEVLARWGLRVVDPAAAHLLLTRLGATEVDARGLLTHAAVRAAVAAAAAGELDPEDEDEVASAVLALAEAALAAGADPAEIAAANPWLASVPLADADGEPAPARALAVPGSWADRVLDALRPVDPDLVERYGGATLHAIGVRDRLQVVRIADVVAEEGLSVDDDAPESELDGWADYLAELVEALEPGAYVGEVAAVADLDAVAEDSWREVLADIAADPVARAALLTPVRSAGREAPSYTSWWLRDFFGAPFAAPGAQVPFLDPAPAGIAEDDDGAKVGRVAAGSTAPGHAAHEGTAHEGTTQEGTAPEGTTQGRTAQEGTAQEGTTQGRTAQEGTAQEGTAQGDTTPELAPQGHTANSPTAHPHPPLDPAVLAAIGAVGDLRTLDPSGWERYLDGLPEIGTPVAIEAAASIWRGLAALVSRAGTARLRLHAERLPVLRAATADGASSGGDDPGPWAGMAAADDVVVAAEPMWAQVADVLPAPASLADAVAEALDLEVAGERTPRLLAENPEESVTPAGALALMPHAPAAYVECDALTVDGIEVDWWVAGGRVYAATTAGLARGLAQHSGRWAARADLEAVLVEPSRAGALVADGAWDAP